MICKRISRVAALAAALFISCAPAWADNNDHGRHHRGVVFTATNAADGNRILVFDRENDGDLRLSDSFPTGGLGTGAGLGNQSGLVLSRDGEWLFAVNAGSDEISLFEVAGDVLVLRDVVPSGGTRPLSIAVNRDLVYVLNNGASASDPDSITGFTFSRHTGRLAPLAGSTRTLSGDNVGPAQVSFNPWGNVLVVTEKATNMITTFTVDGNGLASPANPQASSGATPFGFAFDPHGRLIVSEAFGGAPNASAMSSYSVNGAGLLTTITPTALTHQTAACWVVVDGSGRFAYTTNNGSSSISGYAIAPNGAISLLDASGVTASTGAGSAPIDMAVSSDGRFLYALNAGSNTITGYRIRNNGSLDLVDTRSGLPVGTNGLAAR